MWKGPNSFILAAVGRTDGRTSGRAVEEIKEKVHHLYLYCCYTILVESLYSVLCAEYIITAAAAAERPELVNKPPEERKKTTTAAAAATAQPIGGVSQRVYKKIRLLILFFFQVSFGWPSKGKMNDDKRRSSSSLKKHWKDGQVGQQQ